MDWLNYHHLYYFWVTAREGGLTKGAAKLRLTHSTLSTQLHALEEFLGGELFQRQGRVLVLSPFGVEIARYADDIFKAGSELLEMARGNSTKLRSVLRVGVAPALPKTLAYRLLQPALSSTEPGPVVVRQDSQERLLDDLALSRLHLVLSDQPPPEGLSSKAFGHLLGETEIVIYGARRLAGRYRANFPRSLAGAPMLLPASGTSLRRLLERWLTDTRAGDVTQALSAWMTRRAAPKQRAVAEPVTEPGTAVVAPPAPLSVHEEEALRQLSTMAEPFTLEAIEAGVTLAVGAPPVLDVAQALVERGLLVRDGDDGFRLS